MASVTPRVLSDGTVRWRVQKRVDGKMQQATFIDQKGAAQFGAMVDRVGWAAAKIALDARQKGSQAPTLREWTLKYLDPASGMLTGVEDATREGYRRAAELSFLQLLGDLPVDAITKADVGRWVAWQEAQPARWRKGQTVSQKTVQNYHSVLSAVMRAAVEHKIREDNPAWKTRITRGVKREGVFLSPSEFATLLYFIPDRYVGFVMFIAGTGVRWGEATALRWGDLNLKASPPTARIEHAWKKAPNGGVVMKQPKSRKSKRTVSFTHDIAHALGKPGRSDEFVFPSTVGTNMRHPSFRNNVWLPAVGKAQDEKLCEEAGLEVLRKQPTVHDLRHTHASWLIAAGTPLPYVQARLGHESITTTVGVYGHLQPDAHVQMSDVIAQTMHAVRPLRSIEEHAET